MFSFIFGKSTSPSSSLNNSSAAAAATSSATFSPFASSSASSAAADPQSTLSADAAGPLPRTLSLRSQRSRAATAVTVAGNQPAAGASDEFLLLEKSFAVYRRKIRGREEEIKKRLQTICTLKQQLSCLRPTPTKPSATPEVPVFTPFELPDLRNLPNDDKAVELFNDTIEACIFEIQKLNKKLDESQQEIEKLNREIHGCRLRSRTYNTMIAKGAEIPEYTAFLQQNQRPT